MTFKAMILAFAILLICVPIYAQTDTGCILGSVSDRTGVVVPNVNITHDDGGASALPSRLLTWRMQIYRLAVVRRDPLSWG